MRGFLRPFPYAQTLHAHPFCAPARSSLPFPCALRPGLRPSCTRPLCWPGGIPFSADHFKNWLFLSAACRNFTRMAAELRPTGVEQRRQGVRVNFLHAAPTNSTIFSQICGKRNPAGPAKRTGAGGPQTGPQGTGKGEGGPGWRTGGLGAGCLRVWKWLHNRLKFVCKYGIKEEKDPKMDKGRLQWFVY